jgi:hypothetical protein
MMRQCESAQPPFSRRVVAEHAPLLDDVTLESSLCA